jgi:hypothetical protein
VRHQLGIGMDGHGTFSDSITIYFKGDVRPLLGDRNLSVIYVVHPRQQGFFRFSLDGQSGFLVVNTAVDEAGQRSTTVGATYTEADCVRWVREALGAPDLAVEIEDVQRWNAAAEWSQQFRAGRVFIAGDAGHVMPPTGGYGGNTGVQDAHNLAWKLAAVLNGQADESLLDTYEAERQPVVRMTVEQAYTRYVTRLDPALGTDGLEPVLDDAVIDLGYRYRSAAITADGTDDGATWEDPHAPSGRAGFRAPHIPVRRDGADVSTVDLVGQSFLLLCGSADAAGEGRWARAGAAAAERLGVPLDVLRVADDGDVQDTDGGFGKAYGVEPTGAVLIRPDGIVAWRAADADGPADAVGDALARALCRTLP